MTKVPIIKKPVGKSMNWFLYDRDLRHESVTRKWIHEVKQLIIHGSKIKLNLVQQIFFNPNMPNNVSFDHLIKHWILHIACTSPVLWLKMFVLFKFCVYTKLNLVGGERNWMEKDAPRLPAAISRLRCIKRPTVFSFKLNLVFRLSFSNCHF